MIRAPLALAFLLVVATPAAADLFPPGLARSDAFKIARFHARLPLCPRLKPTAEANRLWTRLWSDYQHSQPDKPAIRAWIASEAAQQKVQFRRYGERDACENLIREFGPMKMVTNKDGSTPRRDCERDDTCASSEYVYFY